MTFTITARCDNGHTQDIHIDGQLGRKWAEAQAGMLDGSSPMFVHSPIGTDSVIGKCGICKAQLHCSVSCVDWPSTGPFGPSIKVST